MNKFLFFSNCLLIVIIAFLFSCQNDIKVTNKIVEKPSIIDTITEIDTVKPEIKQENKPEVKNNVNTYTYPKEEISESKLTLKDFYKQFEKPSQSFVINPQRDTIIIGKEGTRVLIKKNTLVRDDGSEVKTNVRIELKEYYTVEDMILANLSTTSGKQLIETDGMINLLAFENENVLKIKEGNTVQIAMPTEKKKEGMQLFNASRTNILDNINWTADSSQNASSFKKVTQSGVFTESNYIKEDLCLWSFSYLQRGSESEFANYILNNSVPKNMVVENVNFPMILCTGGKCSQNISLTYKAPFYNENILGQYPFELIYFIQMPDGRLTNFKTLKGFNQNLDDEVLKYAKLYLGKYLSKFINKNQPTYMIMPIRLFVNNLKGGDKSIDLSIYVDRGSEKFDDFVGHDIDLSRFSLLTKQLDSLYFMNIYNNKKIIDDSVLLSLQKYKDLSLAQLKKKIELLKNDDESSKILEGIDKSTLNYYILNTAKLGYINCDRFDKSLIKTTLIAKGNFDKNTSLMIVFKKIKAIINGNISEFKKVIFDNIPINSDITLIGIKMINDNPYLFFKDIKAIERKTIEVTFSPVTFEEFRNKIKNLNIK